MANYHLAILKQPYVDMILAGQKVVESRFTKTRRVPFGNIQPGDTLFLKISSGTVCATATVAKVAEFAPLTPEKIAELKYQHNHLIKGADEYWQSRGDCKFGVLLWLTDVETIKPIRIDKKDWRAWVVLTKDNNYGLCEKAL